jgi:hypothetical protein
MKWLSSTYLKKYMEKEDLVRSDPVAALIKRLHHQCSEKVALGLIAGELNGK